MSHSKRILLLGSILLTATLLFTFNLMRSSTASAAVAIGCPPSESRGADNTWVKVIQYRLNGLENNDVFFFTTFPLATDGSFGQNTYRAVVTFQGSQGISGGGGVVGNRTWAALGLCTGYPAEVPSGNTYGGTICPPTESYGSNNTYVNALQHMLNMDKYEGRISNTHPRSWGFPLSQDGSFGSQTKNAVIDFQSANHLRQDGIVGHNTWVALGMCY
jgi:peptidoglycan hydrolase-like protein with peptidoglycan-binding domain